MTLELPVLYGKATSGKIKVWKGTAFENSDGTAGYDIEHGYIDGKLQCDSRSVNEGKNLGKSNETMPYEQAISEVKSHFNKKKDEGYAERIEDIKDESSGFFLPMLAHKFAEQSAKIKYPAALQPKFDGFRCLSKKEDGIIYLWSRAGKPLDVPTEIKAELLLVLKEGEATDGELYHHGWTFQRVGRAIKKRNEDTTNLHYYIYDSPVLGKSFQERYINRWGYVPSKLSDGAINIENTTRLFLVPTQEVKNKDETETPMRDSLEAGFEGLMIRNLAGLYEFKSRSYSLQKIKQFEDDEFEIIGGKEGQGRDSGTVIYKVRSSDGVVFDVRPRGTIEERTAMWNNLKNDIGRGLTVRYQGKSEDLTPRFPVGIAIREDWDK